MALILDPGAIATRSNIGMALEDDEPEAVDAALADGATEYLLMQNGGEHTAVPLESVLRIERIPRSQVERLNGTPVLRFEGTLLPLKEANRAEGAMTDEEMTVVVCRDGERHVGVAVSQVLDVARGKPLAEAGTNTATRDVTLLKDRVTSVVNLGLIPLLPCARSSELGSGQPMETWEADAVVEVIV
jgi:two-component system chemotaxis sensor kinase CheA